MDEYIKRGAVLAKAYWHGDSCTQSNPYPDGVEAVDVSAIEQIPAADVRPVVRGKWIDVRPINQSTFERIAIKGAYNKCSLCGRLCFFEENFCPNCGADMREVSDNG